MAMEKGKRLAVLVGCNYPNTKNELHGCHNDVSAMHKLLLSRFGFEECNIEILIDKPGSNLVMPTGANIKKALDRMVDKAEPGDVLFFHYSGHGTLVDLTKFGHPFKKEEAIVPTDLNVITNVDFRHLVNRLPEGASFTIVSDSCHSGGLIDKEKEQIGPSSDPPAEEDVSQAQHKPKSIPIESILQHLSSLTNINTQDIATHVLEAFGADASIRFRAPSPELDTYKPLKPDDGILLSGCQANETSGDMQDGKRAYGAFSNAIQIVLKENPGALSNRDLVMEARKVLTMQHVEQHPCLYCSDKNADETFLSQTDI